MFVESNEVKLNKINQRLKENKEKFSILENMRTEVEEALRIEEENFQNMLSEDSKKLADFIHEKNCHCNHTDGCSWFYDKDDWKSFSHLQYLKNAYKILKVTNFETAHKIIGLALER